MMQLLEAARTLDAADELAAYRDAFWLPPHGADGQQAYFCGHSLGLQPRAAAAELEQEMQAWRERAVAGHFQGEHPWIACGDALAEALAELTGSQSGEVTVMNTLTVNLHLLMISFFRPAGRRRKILIERGAFPSDRYAVESQIRLHGLDPAECLLELGPEPMAQAGTRPATRLIDEGRIEALLQEQGDEIALVLWPGVQYASGQAFDLRRIAAAARAAGARIGFDLAHAVGNVPLELHDSGCDFAAWCNYKYLNGGPGAVAACFVHTRHHGDDALPRLHGWWGNERGSRFRMAPSFRAAAGAEAWQLSNPPILGMAPLRASLTLFQSAGMARLRSKSQALTGWLAEAIENELGELLEILTPADPERRGCQLSLRLRAAMSADANAATLRGRSLHRWLEARGVVTDWREPDIIRVAPVPLYNRFEEACRFLQEVAEWAATEPGRSGCA
jgi:kynureninase